MMEQRIIWKVIKIGAGNSTHFFVQNDKLCKWLCNWMGYFLNVATLLSNESDFHNSDGLDTYPKSRPWGLEVHLRNGVLIEAILVQLNMPQTHFSANFWYPHPSLLPNHQNSKMGDEWSSEPQKPLNCNMSFKFNSILTYFSSLVHTLWIYWGLWPFGGWDFVLSLRFCNINLHLGKKSY